MEPMKAVIDYGPQIEAAMQHVLDVMSKRVGPEDLHRLQQAYEFARKAHAPQKRKSGEPYILHPIAVATIAAEELSLDTDSVMCALLHDVVEDTEYTTEDIKERFGENVAYLVGVVTKQKKVQYKMSKQVDNYEQLLDSIQFDIRALMVKIADRLHNMRTLQSMREDKQMKIAGETDYFYAPLANRLGLYDVKTDLENLSFKFRCPMEYGSLAAQLTEDAVSNDKRLLLFCSEIEEILKSNNIRAKAEIFYRKPFSIWRKMKDLGKDFKHIDNKYYIRVTYTKENDSLSDKNICLKIYSLLTDMFKEKPQSFNNQIDQAKENSYQSLNVMLLSEKGIWEDVQICSKRMVEISKLGCMAELGESNVKDWMERFKLVLKEIAKESTTGTFIESVVTNLYYDDIMVFTPKGKAIVLPKGATAIDFAFELHTELGLHAKYARINGKLLSVKTPLKRGDCIEIGVDKDAITARPDWQSSTCTFKAKHELRRLFTDSTFTTIQYNRCPQCNPIPGGDLIGIKGANNRVVIHRRSCADAIHLASKQGDSIINIDADFKRDDDITYPVTLSIKAVDRFHFLMDILNAITRELHLSIDSLKTTTKDYIVDLTVTYMVHDIKELLFSLNRLYEVPGVEEIHQLS
jgi:GTP pyrophosphokinase